jgi:hypothetical protein
MRTCSLRRRTDSLFMKTERKFAWKEMRVGDCKQEKSGLKVKQRSRLKVKQRSLLKVVDQSPEGILKGTCMHKMN